MKTPHHPTLPERLLNRLLDHKTVVNCDHDPYLLRWYLFKTRWLSCFIHKFIRSDEDRALHDHPWSFFVVPVWRGYIEHSDRPRHATPICNCPRVAQVRRVWPIWASRYRPATYRHRVELFTGPGAEGFKPSWSLFFHFKREREWGFHPAKGFILWNHWWKENKCE